MKEYERTGYVWEQYDANTGEGRRRCRPPERCPREILFTHAVTHSSHPFTGWTSLVTLSKDDLATIFTESLLKFPNLQSFLRSTEALHFWLCVVPMRSDGTWGFNCRLILTTFCNLKKRPSIECAVRVKSSTLIISFIPQAQAPMWIDRQQTVGIVVL